MPKGGKQKTRGQSAGSKKDPRIAEEQAALARLEAEVTSDLNATIIR